MLTATATATMRWRRLTSFVLVLLAAAALVSSSHRLIYPYFSSSPLIGHEHDRRLLHTRGGRIVSSHALAELPAATGKAADAVLLPEWEALLLLPVSSSSGGAAAAAQSSAYCLFRTGATSFARFAGIVPSSDLAAYTCRVPASVQRLRGALHSPRLVSGDAPPVELGGGSAPSESQETMMRWNRMAYEALSTPGDVIVFAKGLIRRALGVRSAGEFRCVYSSASSGRRVEFAAISSAQEVFRCPHPPPDLAAPVRVSLAFANDSGLPVSSLATYRPAPAGPVAGETSKAGVCACTMILNAAKFLPEWIAYHSAIGVEHFFLYDNGSDDNLDAAVRRLAAAGHNVTTRFWPWPKTQEAGFSHCAALARDACSWMAFIDVDEFVFSKDWASARRPNRSMLAALVDVAPDVGQVVIPCHEFGPSGRRSHPPDGVTQGYTCRRRGESRHKSLVRLDAVDRSLMNSVHHFVLRKGLRSLKVDRARVNHYKYQAWPEFKAKFRRRVSAFVADWTDPTNLGSKDRTPGLGLKAVEPEGWAKEFCDVEDASLRDAARRWFGVRRRSGEHKMAWQET